MFAIVAAVAFVSHGLKHCLELAGAILEAELIWLGISFQTHAGNVGLRF